VTPAGRRRKGSRVEREIVALHLEAGIPARRVPLSGAQEGWKGDIVIDAVGGLVAEVKSRRNGAGWATLARWLGDHDLLVLREDRAEPLVAMPWRTYLRLLRGGKE